MSPTADDEQGIKHSTVDVNGIRLHVAEASIQDTDLFDDLGLTPLDLVLVVLQLDKLDTGDGEFPLYALDQATKVGDLVDLVELWLRRDTAPRSVA